MLVFLLAGILSPVLADEKQTLAAEPQVSPVNEIANWTYKYHFTESDNGQTKKITKNDLVMVSLGAVGKNTHWSLTSGDGVTVEDNATLPFTRNSKTYQWLFRADSIGTFPLTFRFSDADNPGNNRICIITVKVNPLYRWKITTVDNTTDNNRIKDGGLYTSLAIGSDGTPHISYYSAGWGGVRYATRNGDTWSLATVAGAIGTERTSIALNPRTGEPTFLYSDSHIPGGHPDLWYASRTPGGWRYDRVTIKGFMPATPSPVFANEYSLRFDTSGGPHVAVADYDYVTPGIKYIDGLEQGTIILSLQGGLDSYPRCHEPSLALTSTNHPVIAFRNNGDYADLVLIENKEDSTNPVTIVDAAQHWGDTGYFPSIAVDSHDNPHISYRNQNTHDASNNGLRYASRNSSGKWSYETVDQGDMDWTSLVLDRNDREYISYEDHAAGSLKLASRDTPSDYWELQTVDTGNVGACTSIAINPVTGLPAISYHDGAHNALKFAELVPG